MTIEERIQELRKNKGLSQEQLADVLGVSRQAVSKWESGQSLPEIEKLIAMSALFEATIDYILKGETPPVQPERPASRAAAARVGSQIVSAVALMLLAIGDIAAIGQLSDDTGAMDIYGGLVIAAVGVMIMLVGYFVAGNRISNRPLFVVNVLLAGVLPSSLLAQAALGFSKIQPLPRASFHSVLLFAVIYAVICGAVIYFAVVRKRAERSSKNENSH